MSAPVVVFAVGNPSRGDDAIGPLLLARLAGWLADAGLAGDFELVEDFQLQIEHALDLRGRRLALFIDAGTGTPAPYRFAACRPARDASHSTHALSPAAVLEVYALTEGEAPPPAYVLCVRGEEFGLGEPLTAAATAHLESAFRLLGRLCRQAEPDFWRACAAQSVDLDVHHGQAAARGSP